jgi:hypothetical protein
LVGWLHLDAEFVFIFVPKEDSPWTDTRPGSKVSDDDDERYTRRHTLARARMVMMDCQARDTLIVIDRPTFGSTSRAHPHR